MGHENFRRYLGGSRKSLALFGWVMKNSGLMWAGPERENSRNGWVTKHFLKFWVGHEFFLKFWVGLEIHLEILGGS